MEANTSAAPSPSPSSGSRSADTNSADWRSDFKPEMRKRVIQKLIDCFTKKFLIESHLDYNKVKVMAVDYEEKMYHHIRSKDEYIRMINTKLHEVDSLNPSHLNHSEADQTSTHSGSAGVPSELPVTPSTKDNVGHAKQLPLQFMKKKFLHPSRPETHMQHQQREFLQPSQMNYPQQSLIQMNQTHPAMLQAAAHHHLQDHHRNVNQQSSLQQPLQSLSRQQSEHPTLHHQSNSLRQSNPIPQQLVLPSQQRQQFVYKKPNMQQIQMLGQPNKVPDMQQQQQTHQRSFGQTNNVIRQTQKIQVTPLQHQQQLGPQNNIYLPKQQQILGSQSSVSSMEACQKSMRMQQGRCESQQQYQQSSMTSLISQGQSQYPLSQQQLMPQIQSQQQVTMHQPQNSLQTEKQERIQASSVMVQSYISMEQQNQSIQSQTGQKEVSSHIDQFLMELQKLNSSSSYSWFSLQIKSMKESYLPELYKKQQKGALKFQQEERLSPVERSEDFEKMKFYMSSLKKLIEILETSKNDVKADWRDKMPDYERFIVTLLSSPGRKKLAPVQSQAQQKFQHPRVQVRSPIPEEPEKLTGTMRTTPVNVGHQQAEVAQSQTPQNFQNSGGQDIFSTPAELEKPTGTMLTTEANCGYQQTDFAPPPAQDTSIAPRQISGSPLPVEFSSSNENQTNTITSLPSKSISKEDPMDRLIKLIETIPYEALRCSIRDIKSVVRMHDTVAGSAPGNTSRSSIGEDLAATTKWHLQAKNFISQNGSTTTQKMKRSISAVCCDDTSEIEPTAKRQKAEANQDLLKEILETNQQLCFTVIGIIDEMDDSGATLTSNGGGTMVKSSFKTASFGPNLRSKFFSGQMSPITPLRLLIPTDYPKCSPTILDRLQVDQSTESEALSAKVWSVFDRLTRSLEQPVSLREMANMWDISVHKVIAEYDKQSGGGSFRSTSGGWESY